MIEVCDGYKLLQQFGVCYTDLLQKLVAFEHLRADKNCQKSLQNTTLRHQDLEEQHRKNKNNVRPKRIYYVALY